MSWIKKFATTSRLLKLFSLAQVFTPGHRQRCISASLLREALRLASAKRVALKALTSPINESVGKRFLRVLRASVVLLFLSNFNTETRRSRSLDGEISFFPTAP